MRSERLLVSMKNYIGDAVMTEPTLDALEHVFARVEIQAASPVDQVLWRPGTPRTFFSLSRPRSPWELVRQAKELRKHSYDAAVLVNRSFRSALTVRLAGIPTRIGYATEGRGALLTKALRYDSQQFEVQSLLQLARIAGADVCDRVPFLPTTNGERQLGRELSEGCTVGFQPGARWPGKQIPIDVGIEIVQKLVASGEKVALLGGREEVQVAMDLAKSVGKNVVVLAGETPVRHTLGILTNLRGMVGSDTGLMHLAAGVGCPTVTVFGPTCAPKWGHDYFPHRVIRAAEGLMANVKSGTVLDALGEVLRAA